MLGIFIGIVAVVTLISLGQGLESVVIGQFSIVGADTISVMASGTGTGPPGTGVVEPLTQKNLEAIQRISEVDYALGRMVQSGKVEYNNQLEIVFIGSISKSAKENELLNLKATQGRLLKGDDLGRVVVGSKFSTSDTFGKPVQIGSKINIEGKDFQVVGILEKKGSFVTDTTISMTLEDEQKLFNKDDFSLIATKAKKGVNVEDAKKAIEKVMRDQRKVKVGEEDFSVQTNENALENLKSTLFAVQLFVYIIAAISIIVGGIGIMNTMYTSVLERTRDIGVMKSIGAKNSTIFGLFFVESGLLGTVGGIVGVTIGALLAKGLAYVGRTMLNSNLLSAQISPYLIIGALIFSFLVGTISGLAPAIRASKMSPVEALRE